MVNLLGGEASLYLQQHANNPVDWYPWGEKALSLAREQDKPILLSIGYSACHWCHVMAHESFENEATAATMNAHFVNIKVDREERPDLDQVYQTAHAALTRRGGGWPLTMFLSPNQIPFFAGTYFPNSARFGLPAFRELIPRIAAFYHEHAEDIRAQNFSLSDSLESPSHFSTFTMNTQPIAAALDNLTESFDPVWGGFGEAPKFPRPSDLEFCLHRHAADNNPTALDMARTTLLRMANGGIHDQIGGGFYRYSVDRHWNIPHFEKMLYDNASLLALYSDAWAITGEPRFKEVVEQTASWVMREMQATNGGYYATLDADSEHEEGKFYLWSRDQIRTLLTAQEYAVSSLHYGLDQPANFEGHWHLNVSQEIAQVAARLGLAPEEAGNLLGNAWRKLFAAREQRIRPNRDEKILVGWNALMIKGMARAARIFERPDWLASAQAAVALIHDKMWRNGRLLAVCNIDQARLNAYLDDHAFLLDALLELSQVEFRSADLEFSRNLADVLLRWFEDTEHGGFFLTSHDHEQLICRPKSGYDNTTPSGNGVAAYALQRLGHIVGDVRYLHSAERALRLFYPTMTQQPDGFKSLLFALEEFLDPPSLVVIRGPHSLLEKWRKALAACYRPHTLVFIIPNGLEGLCATLDKPVTDDVNAWICEDVKCLQPVSQWAELQNICKGRGFV
jgi:uncharacterized protein